MAAQTQRLPDAARRFGFAVAAGINAAMWFAANAWPGWEAVPFLTEETALVMGLVNLSLVAGVVANLAYLVARSPRVRPLGDLVTTGIGLAAMVRVLEVFPFDFGAASFDWATLFRVFLWIGIVGSGIGIIAQLARLAALGARPGAVGR